MFFPSDFQRQYFSKHGGVTRGPFLAKPFVLLPVLFSLDPSAASLPPPWHAFFQLALGHHTLLVFSCYPPGHSFSVSFAGSLHLSDLSAYNASGFCPLNLSLLTPFTPPDGPLQARGCLLMFSKSLAPAQTSYLNATLGVRIQCLLSPTWIAKGSLNINATALVQATSSVPQTCVWVVFANTCHLIYNAAARRILLRLSLFLSPLCSKS